MTSQWRSRCVWGEGGCSKREGEGEEGVLQGLGKHGVRGFGATRALFTSFHKVHLLPRPS